MEETRADSEDLRRPKPQERAFVEAVQLGKFFPGLTQQDGDDQPKTVIEGVGENGQRQTNQRCNEAQPIPGRLSSNAEEGTKDSRKHCVPTQAKQREASSVLNPQGATWYWA